MNEQHLSQRLAKVATYVPQNGRLADIGSDHAYLPAWLLLNQKIEFAVAGEVVPGPFSAAEKLVKQLALESVIKVRLGNGLEAIRETDDINAITICGMGGSLIRDILDRGYQQKILTGKERLILQPNVGERPLREWLMAHNYQIIAEELLLEDGKRYEIIVAEKTSEPVTYNEQELQFGPYLLLEKSPIFTEKWQAEFAQKNKILSQMRSAKTTPLTRIEELEGLIAKIKEVL